MAINGVSGNLLSRKNTLNINFVAATGIIVTASYLIISTSERDIDYRVKSITLGEA